MTLEGFLFFVAITVTAVFLLWIVPEVLTILWYLHKEKRKEKP